MAYASNYCAHLTSHRAENDELVARLDGGLQKLMHAAVEVDEMKTILAEQTVVVEAKTKEVNLLLDHISKASAEAAEKQTAAAAQQEQLDIDLVKISAQKEEAEEAPSGGSTMIIGINDAAHRSYY